MISKCKSQGFSMSVGIEQSFYRRYTAMRARCLQENRSDYKYYGGKGIKVEWTSFFKFHSDMWESFVAHSKKYGVANTTLDRLNVNKNYSKSNCRWATRQTQSRNSSRPTIVRFKGELHSVYSLSKKTSTPYTTLLRRLKRGMTPEEAVEMPVKRGANQYGN